MKKILLTSAVVIAATVVSFAQGPDDQATLNVNLHDIKTIEVLTKDVNINLANAEDYVNAASATGVTASMAAHLKVASTGAFKVSAKAADLAGPNSETILAENIYITMGSRSSVVNNALEGYSDVSNFNLSSAGAQLFSTSGVEGGTPESIFDVNYTLKEAKYIANRTAGTYTTTIIYTIEAN